MRTNVNVAVHVFRPVLRALRMRDPIENNEPKPEVLLGNFQPLLHGLGNAVGLDDWSVQVIPRNNLHGNLGLWAVFFLRVPQEGDQNTRGIIFVDASLYEEGQRYEENRIKIKTLVIHEFVHFAAWLYALTITSSDKQREETLKAHLDKIVAATNGDAARELEYAVRNGDFSRFNDGHFRVRNRNDYPPDCRIDYAHLYTGLLFSRELFEEEFLTPVRREEIFSAGTEDVKKELLMHGAREVAVRKSVPVQTAEHNLKEWWNDYF